MPVPTNAPSVWQRAKENQKAESRGAAHPPAQSTAHAANHYCLSKQTSVRTTTNNKKNTLGCRYYTELQRWTHFLFPAKHLLWMFWYRYFRDGKGKHHLDCLHHPFTFRHHGEIGGQEKGKHQATN